MQASLDRRSFLSTIATAAASIPFLAGTQSTQAAPQAVAAPDDLDKLFAPIEKLALDIPLAQKQTASQVLTAAIGPDFLNGIEFEKSPDGMFYPVLKEKDAKHVSAALTKFFKDAYGKDVKFATAVSFKGAEIDPESTFRKRTFFIADKPIEDSAKGVSVSFGERLKDQVAKLIPDAPKEALSKLYKYFRDFIYTNQFMIASGPHQAPEDFYSGKIDLDKVQESPGGWHVFSKNGIRLDYNPLPNTAEDSPGSKKGIFAIRNSYNVSLAGKEGEDRMLTVAMGHNHAVIHQSALIDNAKENGGGDHFKQIMSLDPAGPIEGQRHLPYYNHEVIPAKSVEIFTALAA
jgi:hypothetical protein